MRYFNNDGYYINNEELLYRKVIRSDSRRVNPSHYISMTDNINNLSYYNSSFLNSESIPLMCIPKCEHELLFMYEIITIENIIRFNATTINPRGYNNGQFLAKELYVILYEKGLIHLAFNDLLSSKEEAEISNIGLSYTEIAYIMDKMWGDVNIYREKKLTREEMIKKVHQKLSRKLEKMKVDIEQEVQTRLNKIDVLIKHPLRILVNIQQQGSYATIKDLFYGAGSLCPIGLNGLYYTQLRTSSVVLSDHFLGVTKRRSIHNEKYYGVQPLICMMIKKEKVKEFLEAQLVGRNPDSSMFELWVQKGFDHKDTLYPPLRKFYRKEIKIPAEEYGIKIVSKESLIDELFVKPELSLPRVSKDRDSILNKLVEESIGITAESKEKAKKDKAMSDITVDLPF